MGPRASYLSSCIFIKVRLYYLHQQSTNLLTAACFSSKIMRQVSSPSVVLPLARGILAQQHFHKLGQEALELKEQNGQDSRSSYRK